MIKRILLVTAMFSGSALAQQNVDISEADFASGAANARLSALGHQAEVSGKRLVVTAPQHWHAKIAASIRSGGKADLVLKDGFYETLLVRVEDKVVEAPKPEAKPLPPPVRAVPVPERVAAPPPQPEPAPAPVAEIKAPASAPPASSPPPVAPAPAKPVEVPVPMAAAPAEPAPTVAATSSIFVGKEPGDVDPTRTSLEKLYNEGRRVAEIISPKSLRNGDLIYTGNGAAIVVRRDQTRLERYWLEGSLDLNQSGITSESGNKYRVLKDNIR